jgi:NADH-quinone oxidoreductase subunit F/NAD(P)H dehydrogenase (quinone)/NADP-reducing hydrogenase subunit HndC
MLICAGTGCVSNNSLKVRTALEGELKKQGLADEVQVVITGCNGVCAVGPVMVVYPEGIFYHKLTPEDVPHLVEEHLLKGRPVQKLMYTEPAKKELTPKMGDITFFNLQVLRALRNRGIIDAEKIDEYIARDGYMALGKALQEMTSETIIEEMKASGLRGRGGAGFPTGLKWEFAAKASGDVKYALCNGDEGDPGAFMDRSILEADPHAVLEGMTIAAKAIGAHEGHIYCRAEYPLAIERLNTAIDQARSYGLLGENILDSGFDFDIEIYQGAGAFVCGEETALMTSIEGKRGMPRPRPPFPAHQGLWKKPTILNNVETYANVPPIILHGAEWYASLGTEKSKGTKVFALTGAVNNMGGPSGGCIPAELIDTPVDYESITQTGAIMGSGGMVVMDETTCMVGIAKFFLEFTQEESCGKCTPCRIGTKVMLDVLERIAEGKGQEGDVETLQDLASTIKTASLCGLGQTAPNPVLTTIRYFRDEYDAHIRERKCPAHSCIDLLKFEVVPELCKMCGRCAKACPAEAVIWEKKNVAQIDSEKCIRCKNCITVCPFMAIE